MFQEIVYDDLYSFVPLTKDMISAKVCTDDGAFCCLAEFEADFNQQTVFSLGVFRGDHYKDGSVAGYWKMEMCTVIKERLQKRTPLDKEKFPYFLTGWIIMFSPFS